MHVLHIRKVVMLQQLLRGHAPLRVIPARGMQQAADIQTLSRASCIVSSSFVPPWLELAYLSMRDRTSMPAGSRVGTSSARLRAGHFGKVSL